MNRRATLMLVVGGVAGIASPSAWAGAGLQKMEGVRGAPAAAADQAPSARDMKIGSAPQFQNLKEVGPARQVAAIHFRPGTYRVTTADGRSADFWEVNLRFKVDSSSIGPRSGKPVILPTGMMGDRATVFFASPAEMSALLRHLG